MLVQQFMTATSLISNMWYVFKKQTIVVAKKLKEMF
jgi:hypothetical protein